MASKADDAYQWTRDRILSGEFPPRHSLNADELARDLGMSKIPVREALLRLTAEGLVDYRHNSGALVAPLSWRELTGIRAARGALEPVAARLAAATRTNDQIRVLEENLTEQRHRLTLGQVRDFPELNRRFHLAVAECAGLPVLAELIDRTLVKVNRYRAVLPITLDLAKSDLAEHDEIAAAIAAGDPDAAERVTRVHVTGAHTITSEAHRIDAGLFDDDRPPTLGR